MPIFKMSMTAAVGRRPDGTLDFDPVAFRRSLAEVFGTEPEDIILNISGASEPIGVCGCCSMGVGAHDLMGPIRSIRVEQSSLSRATSASCKPWRSRRAASSTLPSSV